MGNEQDSAAAAVMVKVPEQVSWVVQRGGQRWKGGQLGWGRRLVAPGSPDASRDTALVVDIRVNWGQWSATVGS